MSYLEINNITKYYGKQKILDDVSLSLDQGKVLSIIGSSGSGKTTLLRCINLLELPTKGTINIDKDNIFNSVNKYKDSELRKKRLRFGLVFQGFNLFPQYNCLTNITLPLSLREEENRKNGLPYKTKEEITNYAYDLLDRVGLKEKAKSYPCELSGGQAQRVAISRAIALNPDILCFDEPTSALDPLLTNEVLKVISEIKKTLNKTMIIVTHEMEFAYSISDEVIFMDDGKIIERGTPEEIFKSPKTSLLKQFLATYNKIL
jgi:polar amino acid transport system ATP-binding protein